MEEGTNKISELHIESKRSSFTDLQKITPLSKYLTMVLFVILPFIGAWIGYHNAPEKVIEIERNTPQKINVISVANDTDDGTLSVTASSSTLTQLAQFMPVQIGSQTFGGEPIKYEELGFDENNFYINGNIAFSVSEGTFETYLITKGLFGGWIRLDNQIYAFQPVDINGPGRLENMPDMLDTDSFQVMDYGYAHDKDNIYYHANTLEDVKPTNFTFITDLPDKFSEADPLLVVGSDVYFRGKVLEDLDGTTLEVKPISEGKIQSFYVQDEDTIYFYRPVCQMEALEKGTFDEILKYNPVCN